MTPESSEKCTSGTEQWMWATAADKGLQAKHSQEKMIG